MSVSSSSSSSSDTQDTKVIPLEMNCASCSKYQPFEQCYVCDRNLCPWCFKQCLYCSSYMICNACHHKHNCAAMKKCYMEEKRRTARRNK